MARAVAQGKTKSAKRTSRRKKNPKAIPPNCQAINDVFFRRWRDLFGSERAEEHLEDLLRSKPSWHVSARGKATLVDLRFWQRATLSEEINAEGVDCLAVHYTPPVHGPNYSRYRGRFFLRTVDIIEYEERFASGNNFVISDYSPVEKFEQEEGLRPPRLAPAAPPPLQPAPKAAPKKKRRKAKQPSRAGRPAAPAVSEVAIQDVSREAPATPTRKKRQSIKETRVLEELRKLDGECRVQDNMQPADVEKIVKLRDISRRTIYRAYKNFLKEPPAK
jgi:hypothetical protein